MNLDNDVGFWWFLGAFQGGISLKTFRCLQWLPPHAWHGKYRRTCHAMLNAMTLETSSEWDQPAIDTKFIQRALRPVRSRSFHSNSDYPICLPNNPLKQTWYTGMLFPCQDWCLQTVPIEGEQPPKCYPSDSSWGTVFAQALRSGLVVKASGCLKSRCTIPCPSQFRDTEMRGSGGRFSGVQALLRPWSAICVGHMCAMYV